MRFSPSVALCSTLLALVFLASCATKATSPAQATPEPAAAVPAQAPEKVAKQRTVVTKVPVLVKEASFYSDGLADAYTLFKLDADMKNTIEKDSYDASRTDPVQRLLSEYKDGLLRAETVYESDGSLRSRRELSYASGRLVQDRSLDGKGKIQSSSSYTYDASGRKIEWRVLDPAGMVKATTSYAYGPVGLLAVSMTDLAGKASGSIKLEYQGDRLVKRSYFGPDAALQKYEAYVYAGTALATIEYHRADGSLASRTAYSYGSLGELVKAVEYSGSGTAGAYSTYEYQVREDSAIETYYE